MHWAFKDTVKIWSPYIQGKKYIQRPKLSKIMQFGAEADI